LYGLAQDDRNVSLAPRGRIIERRPELDAEGLGQGFEAGAISPGEDRLHALRQRRAAASPT
jgi:hypothetical protein